MVTDDKQYQRATFSGHNFDIDEKMEKLAFDCFRALNLF